MEHLRYRHDLKKWLANEVYIQHEYNKFRRLNVRALAGMGLRMIVFAKPNFTISFSPSYMVEYEELDKGVDESGQRLADAGETDTNQRLSNNLVANLIINKRLQIIYTAYYQPYINDLKDFRILSELSLSVPLISRLEIEISTSIAYDRRPPAQVENLDTGFNNALGLSIKVF